MSTDNDIAEVYYGEIQDKSNQVLRKSGILPFLSDSETFTLDDLKNLDGFQVERLYEQIVNSDDAGLLKKLYLNTLEEEQAGGSNSDET